MYVVVEEGREKPGTDDVGTQMPVQFVEMPQISEIVASIASGTSMRVGPFNVSLRRLRF